MRSFRIFFYALLLAGLAGATRPAAAQRLVWSQNLLSTNYAAGAIQSRHVTDPTGNTYQIAAFYGRLIVGSDTLNPTVSDSVAADGDVLLTKYDATGLRKWYRHIGAPRRGEWSWTIALDGQQNVIIGVEHNDSIQLAGVSIPNRGYLLAKYAPDGTNLWVHELVTRRTRAATGGAVFSISQLSADAAGNLGFTGRGQNLAAIDGVWVDSSATPSDHIAFVGKCNSFGQVQWAQPVVQTSGAYNPSISVPFAYGIATDAVGNLIITGGLGGTTRVGSGSGAVTLTTTRYYGRGYVARFGPGGALLRVTATDAGISAVAVDLAGNAYLTGRCDTAVWSLGGQAGAQRGFFIAKLAPSGAAQWVRQLPYQVADSMLTFGTAIAVDAQGHTLVTGAYLFPVQFGEYELGGAFGYTGAFLARFDAQGQVEWAVPANDAATSHAISQDADGNAYWSGLRYSPYFGPRTTPGTGLVVRKFSPQTTRLTGRAYVDTNGDGQRAPGEGIFPRPLVVENQGTPVATAGAPTGRFHVFADTGSYDMRLPVVPAHYRLTQGGGGYQGYFSAYGQADSARHFGLTPIPNQPDVRVTLTPYGGARRGFVNRYRARVENVGTTTVGGAVTVTFDPALTYTGATPSPTQQAGNSATWNFSGLAPFATRDFDVAATIPLNVALGTVIRSRAAVTVAGDLNAANDADSVRQTVVGSWDPNDLTVNYTSLTPAQIAAGTVLDYTIRFQNLGTDTAFTVVITDTLAANLLRLGTLQLVSQSHNCWWNILGNNTLVVRFDNINLPARSTSALRSMGFVRFQVTPRATLTPGALIPNTAHIVFDYNAPLATNEVTTLVQTPNGLVAEAGDDAAALRLYPNPATETVTLTGLLLPTATPLTVRLLDALGREVRQLRLRVPAGPLLQPLELHGVAPGVYVLEMVTPSTAPNRQRLVVRGAE